MRQDSRGCPADTTILEQRDDFGRKRGKGRQTTTKTGNDEQPPLGRDIVGAGKEGNRETNDVAADNIGSQRTGWQSREKLIQTQTQLPA